jgi:phosphomannomutase / phosphoglucomutase
MKDIIFREYDIRGVVGSELVVEQIYNLARAIAVLFRQLHPTVKTIAIGMDGRTHSPQIAQELVRGLQDSGLDIMWLGTVPTPVLYFSQFNLPVDGGLMVTASHNPAQFNGIKFCLNKTNVWGESLKQLRALYHAKAALPLAAGSYQEVDVASIYIDYLVDQFKKLRNSQMPILFDCANAVSGVIMPRLIAAMGWHNAQILYPELDGTFPNHEPDPVVAQNMTEMHKLLSTNSYTLGIGFDGDADRMAAMTPTGYLIPGDQMLAIFSKQLLKEYPGSRVVFDVRSSAKLATTIEQAGGIAQISPCGHATIKHAMKQSGALLAGEVSCHFFFADRYFGYDDGMYAALRLIELLHEQPVTLDDLVAQLPQTWSTPELRLKCAEEMKADVVQKVHQYFVARVDAKLITIDGVRVQLPRGWGLVRAANTQPAVSLRFEADTPGDLAAIKKEFMEQLAPFFTPSELQGL